MRYTNIELITSSLEQKDTNCLVENCACLRNVRTFMILHHRTVLSKRRNFRNMKLASHGHGIND